MKKTINIIDVGKYFLSIESMNIHKLNMLCYYSQAWYLALFNVPLFKHTFIAGKYGPRSNWLYAEYADWSYYKISRFRYKLPVSTDEQKYLSWVWDIYGDFSGEQLMELAKTEVPWIKAKDRENRIIADKDMQEFYGDKLTMVDKEQRPVYPAEQFSKQTVGDWIRKMDNKELAEFLESVKNAGYKESSITPKNFNNFPMNMLEWIESEKKVEEKL